MMPQPLQTTAAFNSFWHISARVYFKKRFSLEFVFVCCSDTSRIYTYVRHVQVLARQQVSLFSPHCHDRTENQSQEEISEAEAPCVHNRTHARQAFKESGEEQD